MAKRKRRNFTAQTTKSLEGVQPWVNRLEALDIY